MRREYTFFDLPIKSREKSGVEFLATYLLHRPGSVSLLKYLMTTEVGGLPQTLLHFRNCVGSATLRPFFASKIASDAHPQSHRRILALGLTEHLASQVKKQ